MINTIVEYAKDDIMVRRKRNNEHHEKLQRTFKSWAMVDVLMTNRLLKYTLLSALEVYMIHLSKHVLEES